MGNGQSVILFSTAFRTRNCTVYNYQEVWPVDDFISLVSRVQSVIMCSYQTIAYNNLFYVIAKTKMLSQQDISVHFEKGDLIHVPL